MTEDLSVHQGSSVVPALIGTAVGGGGGVALAHYANFGIPGKYAKTWEDAVMEANKNDKYVSNRIQKSEGDVKTAWETLQTQAKAYKDNVAEKIKVPENLKNVESELTAWAEAQVKYDSGIKTKLDDVVKGIKDGSLKDGETTLLSMFQQNYKLDEKVSDEIVKSLKEKDAFKDKADDVIKASEEYAKKVTEHIKSLDNKEFVEFAKNQKAYTEAEKELANEVTTKLSALNTKATEQKVTEHLTEQVKNDLVKAKQNAKNIEAELGKEINNCGKKVLDMLKKPSMLWTGLAGAAALGILTALIAKPRRQEQ